MSKIYLFKHYPPTPPPPFLGPGTFALNSHTYNPLFEKILDPPLIMVVRSPRALVKTARGPYV